MKKDEIMALSFEGIEARAAEIAKEANEADETRLAELNEELDAIKERRAELEKELKEKRAAAAAVATGAGKPIESKEGMMVPTNKEIRNSHEYIEAFAKYIKTGEDMECRALLSDNVNNGVVPVPSFVADIVAERLKESKILSRIRRMEAPGNVKVGFEIEAPAAVAHTEGGDAVAEEALRLGIVNLVPKTYKKWVQISDEALDSMSGEAYLSYIYDEVSRGIIKAEENAAITAIYNAPTTAAADKPAAAEYDNGRSGEYNIADFVVARGYLSSAAENPVILCSPGMYSVYKQLQMAANYGVDPFDGLEVIISDYAATPIIGDLSGLMINLPKGDAIEFKYDDTSLMTSDMVRILGRQPAAIGVVGNNYFVRVISSTE